MYNSATNYWRLQVLDISELAVETPLILPIPDAARPVKTEDRHAYIF